MPVYYGYTGKKSVVLLPPNPTLVVYYPTTTDAQLMKDQDTQWQIAIETANWLLGKQVFSHGDFDYIPTPWKDQHGTEDNPRRSNTPFVCLGELL